MAKCRAWVEGGGGGIVELVLSFPQTDLTKHPSLSLWKLESSVGLGMDEWMEQRLRLDGEGVEEMEKAESNESGGGHETGDNQLSGKSGPQQRSCCRQTGVIE